MIEMNYFLLFWFVIMGCIVLYLAIANKDWFFKSSSVRFIVNHMGRSIARGIYIGIGFLLLLAAYLFFMREIYPTL
ncbi:MAG: Imm17 family immunity protein [Bacteroidales bacterium]|nr:Imm17 family immunity protein [Bacteroidales bacterium]